MLMNNSQINKNEELIKSTETKLNLEMSSRSIQRYLNKIATKLMMLRATKLMM